MSKNKNAKNPKNAVSAATKDSATPTLRPSAINAAAKVLSRRTTPMTCRELIDTISEQGLWKSPAGKTPHATLYAAMFREIKTKGKESRFTMEHGKFSFNKQ